MLTAIEYDQYMCYFPLWFGGVLGLSPEEFKNQYGSQSSRIGSAFVTYNAGIHV